MKYSKWHNVKSPHAGDNSMEADELKLPLKYLQQKRSQNRYNGMLFVPNMVKKRNSVPAPQLFSGLVCKQVFQDVKVLLEKLTVCSTSQEVPQLLLNLKVYCCVQKGRSPVLILSQLHPFHSLQSYFIKIQLNIILLSMPKTCHCVTSVTDTRL